MFQSSKLKWTEIKYIKEGVIQEAYVTVQSKYLK